MTKKEKIRIYDGILNNHDNGEEIIGEPREYILSLCQESDRYRSLSEVGAKPRFHVSTYKIASGRRIRTIFISSKGKCIPLTKGNLFPTKKRGSKEAPYHNIVRKALRGMVEYQISEYRSSLPYSFSCYESGLTIRKGMKFDVDHTDVPFVKLVDDWLIENGLTYEEVVLSGTKNNKRIKDPELAESWLNYHFDYAQLVPVLSSINRSKGCGGYKSPSIVFGSGSAVSLDF